MKGTGEAQIEFIPQNGTVNGRGRESKGGCTKLDSAMPKFDAQGCVGVWPRIEFPSRLRSKLPFW